MTLYGLILDVDGTLADTEELHRQSFNAAFAHHGLPWTWSPAQYRALLRVTGGKERIAHFARSAGPARDSLHRNLAAIEALHRTKTALYTDAVASGGLALRSGIARILREARDAGVRLALATTTSPANVEALLCATLGTHAPGWFDVIVAGDMVVAKKPAPDAYLAVLAHWNVAASRCVAFEDSGNGLAAARAAGVPTVVTPTSWTAGDDFRGAMVRLPSLGDPDTPLDHAVVAGVSLRRPWLSVEDLRHGLYRAA